jgi:hypothetical protein
MSLKTRFESIKKMMIELVTAALLVLYLFINDYHFKSFALTTVILSSTYFLALYLYAINRGVNKVWTSINAVVVVIITLQFGFIYVGIPIPILIILTVSFLLTMILFMFSEIRGILSRRF